MMGEALRRLRDRLAETLFPLRIPGADDAQRTCAEISRQIDDYVLPRLARLDAPLLAVVGGSTGSGKSTLVNAMAGRTVSPAGVLRPTTRSPVLICGEGDEAWFADDRVLPSLPRSRGEVTDATEDEGILHLVRCDTLPVGLAVVDAPDFDSVVEPNRELAVQLLAAADLWLFVTTAARYADAVPWSFLHGARDRGVAVAVVIDRCPEASRQEASEHLAQLLDARGLGDAPFFVLPEVERGELLGEEAIASLRGWLAHVASDDEARQTLVRETLEGAIDSFGERLIPVTRVAEQQDEVVAELVAVVDEAAAVAGQAVDNATLDGSLVRGDVLTRWRELAGSGEMVRAVHAGATSPQVAELRSAFAEGVQAMLLAHAAQLVEHVSGRWARESAGEGLLAGAPDDPRRVSAELTASVRDVVHGWQDRVTHLMHEASAEDGSATLDYDTAALGLILMLVTVTPVGAATGTEVAVARSATRASRKLLESIFGGEAVRRLAATVRRDLQGETHGLLEAEAERYRDLLRRTQVPVNGADRLREVQFGLDAARR